MKLAPVRRLLKEEFIGKGDLPAWVEPLIQFLNNFIFPVGLALSRNLDFANNWAGLETIQTLVHNTPLKINPAPGSVTVPRVKGVQVIDASGQVVTGVGFTRGSDGTISVTVLYQAAGSTSANCTLQIQYG